MIISSKEYANQVEDVICGYLLDAVYNAANEINADFNNMTGVNLVYGAFEEEGYASSYLPEMRDLAIAWMEAMGFDLQSDGSNF